MRSGTDILSQIYTPLIQMTIRSRCKIGVNFVRIYINMSTVSSFNGILGIGRIPFQYNLIIAIAVKVTHTCVVCATFMISVKIIIVRHVSAEIFFVSGSFNWNVHICKGIFQTIAVAYLIRFCVVVIRIGSNLRFRSYLRRTCSCFYNLIFISNRTCCIDVISTLCTCCGVNFCTILINIILLCC